MRFLLIIMLLLFASSAVASTGGFYVPCPGISEGTVVDLGAYLTFSADDSAVSILGLGSSSVTVPTYSGGWYRWTSVKNSSSGSLVGYSAPGSITVSLYDTSPFSPVCVPHTDYNENMLLGLAGILCGSLVMYSIISAM